MPDVSISSPVSGGGKGFSEDDFRLIFTNAGTGNEIFKLARAPKEIEYSGFARTYNEAARPDRKPLLRRSGDSLRKINLTFLLAYAQPEDGVPAIERSIEDRLSRLRALTEKENALNIKYGRDGHLNGDWAVTNLSFRSLERNARTDEITRAEVTLELTEMPDPVPVGLDKYKPRKRPASIKAKKGDTILKIVKKYYATDNAKIVRAIAKVNNIENIKHPLKAGRKIKLP